jgi:hypothetical protein
MLLFHQGVDMGHNPTSIVGDEAEETGPPVFLILEIFPIPRMIL